MSAYPAVNSALADERPGFPPTPIAGAPWSVDWRDRYLVASDEIRNHDEPSFLGVFDGTEAVADWNPWEGVTAPDPDKVLRYGYGGPAASLQVYAQAAPLAIDCWERSPDHGQVLACGTPSVEGMVPLIFPPQSLPYHFDWGDQIDTGQAIGPRQVFRSPPSISDQTAAMYAAGF